MNILIISAGLILFLWFSFPITLNVLNFANVLGMIFSVLLILYGRFTSKVHSFIKKAWESIRGKVILSLASLLIITAVVSVGTMTGFMISAANNAPKEETTVIVLGCKVNPNGPSIMLGTRLQATYDFLTENPDVKCILSGGQGDDEHISEAAAMYEWLTEKGIDGERLYIEDKSTSTHENLRFSKEIIDKNNLCPKVTIITNEFHQFRAGKIAESMKIESYSHSAKTPFYFLATYYVREWFAIVNEFWLK